MHRLAEWALAGLFISWALATVLCQVPSRLQNWLRQSDIFALIPRWHFFAPTPGMHDFVLVYRDQALDGSLTMWREVPGVSVTRQPVCAVWNPGRRHTKAMLDITKELMQLITQQRQKREIELSVPYLSLLNYVSCIPRLGTEDQYTQFALVMSQSSATEGPPAVVFLSSLHEIA
jgi:hypothetical protein